MLDHFTITIFPDRFAQSLSVKEVNLAEMSDMARITSATGNDAKEAKAKLPLWKAATFGSKRSKGNSLRHDPNVLMITGIMTDYDGEKISVEEAVAKLKEHRLKSVVYTSPSHVAAKPRWRSVLPTSCALPPSAHAELVARVNGIFGGALAGESFTLSQAYYFGRINGGADHQVIIVDGDFIDQRNDLDAIAIGKNGSAGDPRDPPKEPESEPGDAGATRIPPLLRSILYLTTVPKEYLATGHTGRSELLRAFINAALIRNVSKAAIVAACLEDRPGCIIFDHCREKGGLAYVDRQVSRAKKDMRQSRSEMTTDLGNARRLVQLHGTDLRYVAPWRKWLLWDGHWKPDQDGDITRKAKATIEEMFAEAQRIDDESRRMALRKHAIASQNVRRVAAMIELAKTEIEVVLAVAKIDADPAILGVANGIVDLKTVTWREANREDYVMKTAGVAFDASAQCPQWLSFLDKIFAQKAELIAYLQRVVGYVLTGLTDEEVIFVLWGKGHNGKSTFREIIFTMMGDYAGGSDASLLMTGKNTGGATPDVARLYGRRLVTINETEKNAHLNEARMKYITSHDIITARNLYQEPFDFTPTHKAFLTTNSKPVVKANDAGTWRRLHLVPFTTIIPEAERDPDFRQKKLVPELAGIFNWALEGLRSYWKIGLAPPAEVTRATQEYREDMDIVGHWIEDRCQIDVRATTPIADLYNDYQQWTEGEGGFAMTKPTFVRELVENHDFDRVELAHHVKGLRGLKLMKQTPVREF